MNFIQELYRKWKERERLEILLNIRETKLGIETYVHPDLDRLEEPYKKQIRAFLSVVDKNMGGK